MGKVVLDNRFWLMWLASVVAAFFSIEVHAGGYLDRYHACS
ncbi:hypothetical protein [Helicobacter felistomachi]|nr:hypothetical protein [Helicobacter sp. NHP21005]